MTNPILDTRCSRADLDRRIAELRVRAAAATDATLREYAALEADFQPLADEARSQLLGTALTWSERDRAEAAWLRRTSDHLALMGYSLCEALLRRPQGKGDARTLGMMARTLLHMGNVVKWEVAVVRDTPHDFGKPHAIIRAAMATGHHRDPIRMSFDGRETGCTLESLYFRALLLARFSSGALNSKQIEILDAWMWMWMPALQGAADCPAEGALRADLDSTSGLQRGRREDPGPALYLPPAPIEEAYRTIVREFHAGRMVPATGITAEFRIEEHVAVLELIRKGLRQAVTPETARAPRAETDHRVELLVGLQEVLQHGFGSAPAAPILTLAALDGERLPARIDRDRDANGESAYDRPRRMVRVANVSESGFGIEATERDCGSIAVGDVVALRLDPTSALEICKVVRCVPTASAGVSWLGVRRVSQRARLIEVAPRGPAPRRASDASMLFVPGPDESGRYDACLVSEHTYANGSPIEAYVGDFVYRFQFNRPRERGRGWVLAGFEMLAAAGARTA